VVLCCILAVVTAWQGDGLKHMHKQVLEEEKTFAELPAERQALFLRRAARLERWHTALVVAFILLGYAVALWLGHEQYPQVAERLIPVWLVSYL
jgi:hypothetical protein